MKQVIVLIISIESEDITVLVWRELKKVVDKLPKLYTRLEYFGVV